MMNIPRATYRLQFNHSFGFKKAREIVSYLHDLGISHIYASPIFKAKKGSMHGYDVVDPAQLNAELGSNEDFENLIQTCHARGMAWIQDIVPNHMAYDSQNSILMDVLEKGQESQYAVFFDIMWDHPYENMKNRVLSPFLGSFYARALEDGEIQLSYDEKGFFINYYDIKFPLKIESYIDILKNNISLLEQKLSRENPEYIKFIGLISQLEGLVKSGPIASKQEQIHHFKKMLNSFYTMEPEIKDFIDQRVALFNGSKGEPSSFDLLDRLIAAQHFRLSFWKVAAEEINYRRFFTINELISLRVEDENVFNQAHRLIFLLLEAGKIDGLRVDHIDGLSDPQIYLQRLTEKTKETFIIVEKILGATEVLPSWPVAGTTGYDFMFYINNLFCVRENERLFSKLYYRFAGLNKSYDEIVAEKKRMIIGKHLAGNIDNLAHFLKNITSNDRDATDITLFSLKRALTEVFVFFPVYRTYVNANTFSEVDKRYIQQAIDIAKENRPYLLNELNFLQKFILFENADTLDQENRNKRMNFIMNFQQYSGPLMAKGFEDTVLYIYNRLISLNEVGGHPEYFGISLETFHGFCKEMSEKWPHSLCATSTHDTKRGEDARSRINVLSEIPRDWAAHIKKWTAYNRKYKKKMGDSLVPDKNDEYFIYQTLIGTYPFDGRLDDYKKRLQEYMIKSVREAKVHTAWITNDSEYENACTNFIEQILKAGENNLFLNDFLSFHKITSFYGILNSLSQTLIKLTVPGVPDFYQGCELWDFSFVDPDNRRQVDYAMRMTMLEEIKAKANQDMAALLIDLLNTFQDGRIKLYLVHVLLEFRKNHLQLFESGAYIPIEIEGTFKENIVAFIRKTENKTALMIAPRFYSYFTKAGEMNNASDAWGDTTLLLPETVWPLHVQSIITGRNIYLENKKTLISNILTDFPLNAFVNT